MTHTRKSQATDKRPLKEISTEKKQTAGKFNWGTVDFKKEVERANEDLFKKEN